MSAADDILQMSVDDAKTDQQLFGPGGGEQLVLRLLFMFCSTKTAIKETSFLKEVCCLWCGRWVYERSLRVHLEHCTGWEYEKEQGNDVMV